MIEFFDEVNERFHAKGADVSGLKRIVACREVCGQTRSVNKEEKLKGINTVGVGCLFLTPRERALVRATFYFIFKHR